MRLFTQDEANEALATVRPLAERLVTARRELARAARGLERLHAVVSGNGGALEPAAGERLRARAERAAGRVEELVGRLEEAGVQVKDLDRGLLDFPAAGPDGEVVLLCWQVGEPAVEWWHGVEEGFAGRKPLPF